MDIFFYYHIPNTHLNEFNINLKSDLIPIYNYNELAYSTISSHLDVDLIFNYFFNYNHNKLIIQLFSNIKLSHRFIDL